MSMLLAAASALNRRRGAVDIADLFDITLDTAANLDGVSTTGWDLLVGKSRVNSTDWVWRDTAQGISDYLKSNAPNGTDAAAAFSDYATLLGAGNGVLYRYKQHPKFCAVVAFTHTNGVTSNIPTGLTVPLGLATVKRLDSTSDWYTNHRSLTAGYNLRLNTSAAESNTAAYVSFSGSTVVFSSAAPSGDYVAYVWGHDVGDSGVIQCGVYTGNGSTTGPTVALGWQPQWLLVKSITGGVGWYLFDAARNPTNPVNARVSPDTADAEATNVNAFDFTATGFDVISNSSIVNGPAAEYAYVAIRSAA
ncbi:MAG: hypothetical protein Q7J57_14775 [Gemmobacter sp.]|nr:hypothetical protein [Gemmobacter sp.]